MADDLDMDKIEELAKAATPGARRRKTLGGASTVLLDQEPPRNDTRIVPFGYDRTKGHCIAYPDLNERGEARMDFVCFGHADAEFIAALSPKTILSLIALVRLGREREAEIKRLPQYKLLEAIEAFKALAAAPPPPAQDSEESA